MILRFLVDYGNIGSSLGGDYYMMTIETEDKASLINELKRYSKDVLYIDSKDELGAKDKGKRRLDDGSIIRRCQWWGSKIGYCMRFETSPYRMETLKKAVVV